MRVGRTETFPRIMAGCLPMMQQTLALVAAFNSTPNGGLGAVWMSGGGTLRQTPKGNIYVSTGNGTFALSPDPGSPGYGDSVLKLDYDDRGLQCRRLSSLHLNQEHTRRCTTLDLRLKRSDAASGSTGPASTFDDSCREDPVRFTLLIGITSEAFSNVG